MKKSKLPIIVRQAVVIVTLCLTTSISWAIPAQPGKISVTQPDGSSIEIQIHGDELFNYTTSSDGYVVALGSDNFYYYANYNTGSLSFTTTRVGQSTSKTNLTKGVLASVWALNRIQMRAALNQAATRSTTRAGGTGYKNHPPRIVVVLTQYQDIRFEASLGDPQENFTNLLNQRNYAANEATGSVADYYDDNSNGAYRPVFVVSQPVTLSKNRKEYGTTSNVALEMARAKAHTEESCKLASQAGVNFADYDADNDGVVDGVLIIYAGGNPAEGVSQGVWPHSYTLSNFSLNGKELYRYTCVSELRGSGGQNMAGIGTTTHEFGHMLGLADLYNTNTTVDNNTEYKLWGKVSLMSMGPYNNSGRTPPYLMGFEREMLGWVTFKDITDLSAGVHDITLRPIATNDVYRLKTDVENEYYTFENRVWTAWDSYVSSTPTNSSVSSGMLVMHIDRSENIVRGGHTASYYWAMNDVVSIKDRQLADFVESTGSSALTQSLAGTFFPGFKQVTTFDKNSKPKLVSWSQNDLGASFTDIAISGENITFKVDVKRIDRTKVQLSGVVRNFKQAPLAGVTVNFYESAARSNYAQGLQYSMPSTRISQSTTTNSLGEYSMPNVDPGEYVVEIDEPGYRKFYEITSWLTPAVVTYNPVLLPLPTDLDYGELFWHDNTSDPYFYTVVSRELTAGALFTPADLELYSHNTIESVTVRTKYPDRAHVATLRSGTIVLASKSTFTTSGSDITFDFSDLNIQKMNSKELLVSITTLGAIAIDKSTPMTPEKGALISNNGLTWESLDNTTYNGNWMITLKLNTTTPSPSPVVTNVSVTPNQQEAYVTWQTTPMSGVVTKWLVKSKKSTDTEFSLQTVTRESCMLKKLEENQNYIVEVTPLDPYEIPLLGVTKTFSTQTSTSPYTALSIPKFSYEVGDELPLVTNNKLPGYAWIIYRVNGVVYTGDSYTFTAPGTYKIEVEIAYSKSGIETLTRRIKVK